MCIDNNDDFDFSIDQECNVDEPYREVGEQEALLRRLGEIKRNELMEGLFR